MNSSEIRRLIRKLSRRRHWAMKRFTWTYPLVEPDNREWSGREVRREIAALDGEIDILLGRLGA